MNIFISGGCKNGKSHYAQRCAKEMASSMGVPLYYVATMEPHDEEDRARIRRHIEDRAGWGFQTVEQPADICRCLADGRLDRNGAFLLDSVTALMANELFSGIRQTDGERAGLDGERTEADDRRMENENAENEKAAEQMAETALKVAADLAGFAELTGNTVFVSDFIYSDAAIRRDLTEQYLQALAAADRRLAEICDEVIEVTYGNVISHGQRR